MRIGKLRHFVQVQRPIKTQTSTGAETVQWALVTSIWADVIPATTRQRERLAGNQILADMDTLIRMRVCPAIEGINATWRVVYKTKIYNLLGVANVDERDKEFELQCKVGMNDG